TQLEPFPSELRLEGDWTTQKQSTGSRFGRNFLQELCLWIHNLNVRAGRNLNECSLVVLDAQVLCVRNRLVQTSGRGLIVARRGWTRRIALHANALDDASCPIALVLIYPMQRPSRCGWY